MLKRTIRALCLPCMLLGMGIFFAVFPAMAADEGRGFTLRDGFLTVLSIALMLGGAYIKGLEKNYERRFGRLEKEVDDLEGEDAKAQIAVQSIRELVLANYNTKTELAEIVRAAIRPLEQQVTSLADSVAALHRRMDKYGPHHQ
jgi:hypothetical protein